MQNGFRSLASIIALIIFLALPAGALACVPTPSPNPRIPTATPRPTDTPAEAARKQMDETRATFGDADIVFRGVTTKTETFVTSQPFGADVQSLRAFFGVDTVWKGSVGQQVTVYSHRRDVSDCDFTAGRTGPPYPLHTQTTYLIYARLDTRTQTYEISNATDEVTLDTDIAVLGPGTPVAVVATPAPTAVAAVAPSVATAAPLTSAQTGSSRQSATLLLLLGGGGIIGAALVGFAFGRRRRRA